LRAESSFIKKDEEIELDNRKSKNFSSIINFVVGRDFPEKTMKLQGVLSQ